MTRRRHTTTDNLLLPHTTTDCDMHSPRSESHQILGAMTTPSPSAAYNSRRVYRIYLQLPTHRDLLNYWNAGRKQIRKPAKRKRDLTAVAIASHSTDVTQLVSPTPVQPCFCEDLWGRTIACTYREHDNVPPPTSTSPVPFTWRCVDAAIQFFHKRARHAEGREACYLQLVNEAQAALLRVPSPPLASPVISAAALTPAVTPSSSAGELDPKRKQQELWSTTFELCQREGGGIDLQRALWYSVSERIFNGDVEGVNSADNIQQCIDECSASFVEKNTLLAGEETLAAEITAVTEQAASLSSPASSPSSSSSSSLSDRSPAASSVSSSHRYHIREVAKDGNCAVESMAVVLASNVPPVGQAVIIEHVEGRLTQWDASTLRAEAVAEMRRYRRETTDLLLGDDHLPNESQEQYLARMERPGEWMNGAALGALGVRHHIKVICCFRDPSGEAQHPLGCLDCTSGVDAAVAVILCWTGQHYEPLGRWDDVAGKYVYQFRTDEVDHVTRTDARECLEAWLQSTLPGADVAIKGVTDKELLIRLNEKRRTLQLDFLILHEDQAVTPHVIDKQIERLERMRDGVEWKDICRQLKKSLSGRGSVAPVKRGSGENWVCEDQSVLSLREDGWDRHSSTDREMVEAFRKEHIWRRMLMCAMMREKRPQWVPQAGS